ncbi:hypothetical protein FF011L_23150 [Roseimaritima multifibrata]|uniref:Thiol-disulfide oxidoreductase n=1 Tax=Roseimaritima multifibrata TaxID=1930274 RepID=A0A517MF85_9BACT|nr:redoxin domain-containing protein [Roseimaritima multifibrata]QDS93545.1 hypothetical protein FF011L_23150 [Roseimaritima multifibrata]
MNCWTKSWTALVVIALSLSAVPNRRSPVVAAPPDLGPVSNPASPSVTLESFPARTVNGDPIEWQPNRPIVLCFLGTECPLARLYAPRLQRLADQFEDSGFQFLGVDSNRQDSPAEIQAYQQETKILFPLIKDVDQRLAKLFGAVRTPQVFVLSGDLNVVYQGRIDDQYEPGLRRAKPTKHELHDALVALDMGQPIAVPETEGVGCLITYHRSDRHRSTDGKGPTYWTDVAPLLNKHCVECHREGEIGPMALIDYDEVAGWADMTLEVIENGRMPPWHADPRFGEFVGARRVPDADRQIIADWIEAGMPEGIRNDADIAQDASNHSSENEQSNQPIREQAASAAPWHLTSLPDEQWEMRSRPFSVPADGVIEYQYFVVDPGWTTDRWVTAAQVIPGDSTVVHHAIVFVRPPDGSGMSGVGWLGGYVPGQRTRKLPSGYARRVQAGSKLVFQMHYTPNGTATTDLSKMGVWYASDQEVEYQVSTRLVIDHEFEIPPRNPAFEVPMQLSGFSPGSELLSVTPHMHLRGRSFRMDVQTKSNENQTLLSVPEYDFNWQHTYQFVSPLQLDEIERLEMSVQFDNSAGNPNNPAPDEYVTWGDQTWEEMSLAYLDIATPIAPRASRRRSNPPPDAQAMQQQALQQKQTKQATFDFLKKFDGNGDGIVVPEETPLAFQRFGFRKFDLNDDDRLDQNEIEQAAAARR